MFGWSRGGVVRTIPFDQNSNGARLVPVDDGSVVACAELKLSDYIAAATTLGISEAVQKEAWYQAVLGHDRIFIPQSLATSVVSGVARCELGMDPAAVINFGNSLSACEAMGDNWTLMTQAQWHIAAVISQAYWSGQGKSNPTGNTEHGRSHAVTSEVGIRSDGLPVTGSNQGSYGRTLTSRRAVADGGGQLLAWSHDGTAGGIFDLVGNAWEWASRGRIVSGEIQIIPASAGVHADHGVSSTAWRAMLADGTLVSPGTSNTLKYSTDSGIYLSTTAAGSSADVIFKDIGAGAISPVPPMLIAMGLFPWSSSVPTVGRFYANTAGERLPLRGGSWGNGSDAGVSALSLGSVRGNAGAPFGFRPSYVL